MALVALVYHLQAAGHWTQSGESRYTSEYGLAGDSAYPQEVTHQNAIYLLALSELRQMPGRN